MSVILLRRAAIAATAAFALAAASHATLAQSNWPDKPIHFIVPYPPGGGTDVIARIVQERFQKELGQPIIIDNRGGAAGSLGMDASLPQILVANLQFPANNVAELTALAKAKPGTLAYASVGNGSPGQLAGEMYKLRTGTQLTHVPYRGGGPAMNDLMGGQVPLLWVSIPAAAQFVKTGKVKALAVSTVKRSAAFPDVPTMQEAGVPDFNVDSWYAMFVPAKTPKPIIEKLNKALNVIVREPAIRDRLLQQGAEGAGGTPEALGKVVDSELVRWAKLVKAANIHSE